MSLSDKYTTGKYGQKFFLKEDVREAVKDLKEDIIPNDKHIEGVSLSIKQILELIDKIFGEKLVNEHK